MLIRGIYPTLAVYTGYLNECLTKNFIPEKDKSENERVKKVLKEQREKIAIIYNSKGKVMGYDKNGKRLDILI